MNKYIILVSISLFFVVFVNANSRFPLSSLISNPFDESNDVTIKKSGTIKLPKVNSVKRIGKIGMNIKSLFEDTTCSLPNNCIGVGATCDSDYTTNDEYCSNSTAKCCASNLFCVNKVCATTLIGSACITNSTIPNNSFYVCVNNVIQLIRYPGDSCSSNGECFGSTCVNGVCQGAALNQNCDYNNLCQPSNYCYYNITNKLNSTCTAPAANGHACDNSVYGVQCQPQLYCNQGKCAIPYLGSDGDSCTYDKDCGVSMSCIKGTCTTNTLVMTSCKSNKDCGTLSTCQCMGTGGLLCAPPNMTNLPNDPCAVQYYNLEKCAFENNCEIYPSVLFLMENLITDDSQYCISSKCTKPLHQLRECTCVAKTVPSVCYHNPGVQICGALRKYEYFLVIIGCSFAGVTFVLMGICLVDRKRRGDRSWF